MSLQDHDDAQLLAAVADGDRGALRELMSRHGGWLVLRLSQRCDDPGLIDEVVQDTFVRVWRKAHTLWVPQTRSCVMRRSGTR